MGRTKAGEGDDEFVRRVHRLVEEARTHGEWRLEYMTLLMRDQENRELGRVEGLAEGETKKGIRVYQNLRHQSMSQAEAQRLAEISDELVKIAEEELVLQIQF